MAKRVRAFTLIELLVVVGIIGIIAGVVIPMTLASLSRARSAQEQIRQTPPTAISLRPSGARGLDAQIISSDIKVRLDASPFVDGLGVHTRYEAKFSGAFVFKSVDPSAEHITLNFPFPPGMSEARGVELKLGFGDEAPTSALGARYDMRGVQWTGAVQAGQAITALIKYKAAGQDRYAYDLSGGARTGTVRFTMVTKEGTPIRIPSDALLPTARDRGTVVWSFDNLIAKRSIVVELPAGASPLGRLIFLFKLAAFGVLIFGAGFWYLSEEQKPGRLDDFRWGHFLLLALNYSSFFAALGVVSYRYSLSVSLGVATLVSLPLLGLHVARISDARFALLRVLPLAIYTFVSIVSTVFLEAHKPMIMLASAMVAVAYLTITYRSWSAARVVHGQLQEAQFARRRAKRNFDAANSKLMSLVEESSTIRRSAERVLMECPVGFELERATLDRALRRLAFEVSEAQKIIQEDEPTITEALERLATERTERHDLIQAMCVELQSASEALKRAICLAKEQLWTAIDTMERAMQTASALSHEAAMSLDSDTETQGASETVSVSLTALALTLDEAEQLRRRAAGRGGQPDFSPKEIVARASRVRGRIEGRSQKLQNALLALNRAEERANEQRRQRTSNVHCSACGGGMTNQQAFCGSCGTPKPHRFDCDACGGVLHLPVQVTKKRSRALHCGDCGGALKGEPKVQCLPALS